LIGRELRDQQYNVSLGGGADITREPRNGRNFEYQGEDPVLAGKMVAQLIRGLQSQNVIGDVKHYAFNDQETGATSATSSSANAPCAKPTCWRLRSPSPKGSPAW
jgi:beta-glucosidase